MRGTLHKFISMLLSTTVNNYCLTWICEETPKLFLKVQEVSYIKWWL
jgi:hypothetical protein